MDLGQAGIGSDGPVAVAPHALDQERVARAKRGDLTAFNQLVLAYQELAYNVALRLVGDADLAADVTQEAFLSAYRHLGQFQSGSFRAWVLRIVTNGSYDALRARKRHPDQSLDDLVEESSFDLPDPAELPEKLSLRREQIEGINVALQTLPIEQRTVLTLYDIHGLSYEEITAVLDVNLGTVKSRLHRARSRLRDYFLGRPELWQP